MKSKFTSVVRVKKQEMDKVEAKLVVARLNVRNAEEKKQIVQINIMKRLIAVTLKEVAVIFVFFMIGLEK